MRGKLREFVKKARMLVKYILMDCLLIYYLVWKNLVVVAITMVTWE